MPQITAPPDPAKCRKRIRYGRNDSIRNCMELQRFAFEIAKSIFESCKSLADKSRFAGVLPGLVKAWVLLQDEKRELRGKPKLGVLNPSAIKRLTRGSAMGKLIDIASVDIEPEPDNAPASAPKNAPESPRTNPDAQTIPQPHPPHQNAP